MNESTKDRESRLLPVILSNPVCAMCWYEVAYDGDVYVCEDCGVFFDLNGQHPSLLDPNAEQCGQACRNMFHGIVEVGNTVLEYKCNPCVLSADHGNDCWHACARTAVRIGETR